MAVSMSPYRTAAPVVLDELELETTAPPPPVDDNVVLALGWDGDCEPDRSVEISFPALDHRTFAVAFIVLMAAVILAATYLLRPAVPPALDRGMHNVPAPHMNLRTVNR